MKPENQMPDDDQSNKPADQEQSNQRERPMEFKVDPVWDSAFQNYFLLLGSKLFKACPSSDNQVDFECYVMRLRLHFLFPDLTDQERELLFGMSCIQRSLHVLIGLLGAQR